MNKIENNKIEKRTECSADCLYVNKSLAGRSVFPARLFTLWGSGVKSPLAVIRINAEGRNKSRDS